MLVRVCWFVGPLVLARSDGSSFPSAAKDISNSSRLDERRAVSTKYYVFGISLSLEAACENDIGACVGSNLDSGKDPCHYCTSALVGLKFWKNWINNKGKPGGGIWKTVDQARFEIDYKVRYDRGNLTIMEQNYEELATWNQGSSADANKPMLLLFGPSNHKWNAQAAAIAAKHNIVMILWTTEYGVYHTAPGPEYTYTNSLWKEWWENWLNTIEDDRRRILHERTSADYLDVLAPDDGECNPLVTDHCFMPSPDTAEESMRVRSAVFPEEQEAFARALDRGWRPTVEYRKSLPGDRTAADLASVDQHSRLLRELQSMDSENSYKPCARFQFAVFPMHLQCSPATSPSSGGKSFYVSANTAVPVMMARVGTASFSVQAQPANAIYGVENISLEIWTVTISGTDVNLASCLFGQAFYCQYRSACSGGSSDYCYSVQGTNFNLRHVNRSLRISVETSLTLDVVVQVASNMSLNEEVLVSYEYTEVTPCPNDQAGCRHCSQFSCEAGLYPQCDGTYSAICSIEPSPNGAVWELGLTNVLDINIRLTAWAFDPLNQVYEQGARKFIFIHMERNLTGDEGWGRQCAHLSRYTSNLNGTSVLLYRIRSTATLKEDMRFLRAEEPDAFVHCGRLASAVLFAMSAKAFGLLANAFIWDRPFGFKVINNTKAFNSNWFLEPMPMHYNDTKDCAVFGSKQLLQTEWTKYQEQEKNQDPSYPDLVLNYASMQTLALGALITRAIETLSEATLLDAVLLAAAMRQISINTFFGEMAFEANGLRKSKKTSTRQYKPVPINWPGSDEVVRYEYSNIEVVENDLPAPRNTLYFSPGWIEKELQVYPCEAGCVFHTKLCVPCTAGSFRGPQDIDCRPCGPGRYADVIGMADCIECPEGSECQGASIRAKPMYQGIQIPGNWTALGDNFSLYPNRYCVDPDRRLTTSVFVPCFPTSVCVGGDSTCIGSNQGLLCGQCALGDTYNGLLMGKRECKKCVETTYVILCSVALAFCFGVSIRVFAAAALKSAGNSADLSCAILRTLLHYVHIVGIVKEATSLDSNIYIAILTLPIDVFIRPFELIEADCMVGSDEKGTPVKTLAQISLFAPALVIGAIIASHVAQGAFSYMLLLLKLLWRVAKASSSAALGQTKKSVAYLVKEEQMIKDDFRFGRPNYDTEQEGETGVAKKKGKLSIAIGKAKTTLHLKKHTASQKDAPKPEASKAAPQSSDQSTIKQLGAGIDETEVANADSLTKKPKSSEPEFYQFVGPGAAFVSMHETFALLEHFRTFCRECLVATIFMYPVIIRATRRVINCRPVDGVSRDLPFPSIDNSVRLVMDFDIICGSPKHNDLAGFASVQHWVVLFGMPFIVFAILMLLRHEYFDIGWRRFSQILHDGHKPEKWYWEVVMFLRTGLLVTASSQDDLSARCLFMLLILVFYLCATVAIKPYEFRDRQVLHFIDLSALVSVQIVTVAGMVVQYEYDPNLATSWTFNDSVKTAVLVVVVLANTFTLTYGVFALTFNTICLKLQAIVRSSELCVDATALRFHRFVQLTFRGMNPVGYYSKNGRHFIDVSNLDEGERKFLVLSLTETMGACFDSGSKIHTWLLENAIHEAFDRAMQARDAQLRGLYQRYGGRHFHLINLMGFIKLFRVTLRPPDIPDNKVGMQRLHAQKHDGESEGELQKMGITVEELHNALSSVNVDVLERHPAIHKPRAVQSEMYNNAKHELVVSEKRDHYALTWQQGASLAVFEDFAKTWGSLRIDEIEEKLVTGLPDENLWNDLQGLKEKVVTFKPGYLGFKVDEKTEGFVSDVDATEDSQAKVAQVQIGWRITKVNGRPYAMLLEDFKQVYPGDWSTAAANDLLRAIARFAKHQQKHAQVYQILFQSLDGKEILLSFRPEEGEHGLALDENPVGHVANVASDLQGHKKGVEVGWRIVQVNQKDFSKLLQDFISRNLQNRFWAQYSEGKEEFRVTFEAHAEYDSSTSKAVTQQRLLEEQHAMMQEEILQLRFKLREEELKLNLPGHAFLHDDEAFIRATFFNEGGEVIEDHPSHASVVASQADMQDLHLAHLAVSKEFERKASAR